MLECNYCVDHARYVRGDLPKNRELSLTCLHDRCEHITCDGCRCVRGEKGKCTKCSRTFCSTHLLFHDCQLQHSLTPLRELSLKELRSYLSGDTGVEWNHGDVWPVSGKLQTQVTIFLGKDCAVLGVPVPIANVFKCDPRVLALVCDHVSWDGKKCLSLSTACCSRGDDCNNHSFHGRRDGLRYCEAHLRSHHCPQQVGFQPVRDQWRKDMTADFNKMGVQYPDTSENQSCSVSADPPICGHIATTTYEMCSNICNGGFRCTLRASGQCVHEGPCSHDKLQYCDGHLSHHDCDLQCSFTRMRRHTTATLENNKELLTGKPCNIVNGPYPPLDEHTICGMCDHVSFQNMRCTNPCTVKCTKRDCQLGSRKEYLQYCQQHEDHDCSAQGGFIGHRRASQEAIASYLRGEICQANYDDWERGPWKISSAVSILPNKLPSASHGYSSPPEAGGEYIGTPLRVSTLMETFSTSSGNKELTALRCIVQIVTFHDGAIFERMSEILEPPHRICGAQIPVEKLNLFLRYLYDVLRVSKDELCTVKEYSDRPDVFNSEEERIMWHELEKARNIERMFNQANALYLPRWLEKLKGFLSLQCMCGGNHESGIDCSFDDIKRKRSWSSFIPVEPSAEKRTPSHFTLCQAPLDPDGHISRKQPLKMPIDLADRVATSWTPVTTVVPKPSRTAPATAPVSSSREMYDRIICPASAQAKFPPVRSVAQILSEGNIAETAAVAWKLISVNDGVFDRMEKFLRTGMVMNTRVPPEQLGVFCRVVHAVLAAAGDSVTMADINKMSRDEASFHLEAENWKVTLQERFSPCDCVSCVDDRGLPCTWLTQQITLSEAAVPVPAPVGEVGGTSTSESVVPVFTSVMAARLHERVKDELTKYEIEVLNTKIPRLEACRKVCAESVPPQTDLSDVFAMTLVYNMTKEERQQFSMEAPSSHAQWMSDFIFFHVSSNTPGPEGLSKHGLQVVRVPGDGSCFFHSIRASMGSVFDRNASMQLRAVLSEYLLNTFLRSNQGRLSTLESNEDQLQGIASLEDMSAQEYLQKMKVDSSMYAEGAIFARAAADHIGATICIFALQRNLCLRYRPNTPDCDSSPIIGDCNVQDDDICIVLDCDGEHYNGLKRPQEVTRNNSDVDSDAPASASALTQKCLQHQHFSKSNASVVANNDFVYGKMRRRLQLPDGSICGKVLFPPVHEQQKCPVTPTVYRKSSDPYIRTVDSNLLVEAVVAEKQMKNGKGSVPFALMQGQIYHDTRQPENDQLSCIVSIVRQVCTNGLQFGVVSCQIDMSTGEHIPSSSGELFTYDPKGLHEFFKHYELVDVCRKGVSALTQMFHEYLRQNLSDYLQVREPTSDEAFTLNKAGLFEVIAYSAVCLPIYSTIVSPS